MKASTAAVHILLALGVITYTLLGALVMQHLESPAKRSVISKTTNNEEKLKEVTRIYPGSAVSAINPGVYECLQRVLDDVMAETKCMERDFELLNISQIDECNENVLIDSDVWDNEQPINSEQDFGLNPLNAQAMDDGITEEEDKWSFGNSLIFTFSVITTIGYGHVAPETFYGRIFCIVFGLIGVPLTLLTIANLGMFISIALKKVSNAIHDTLLLYGNCLWSKAQISSEPSTDKGVTPSSATDLQQENVPNERNSLQSRKTGEAMVLGLTFVCYLVLGAKVLASYEPELDFFNALYFNFVTLTTIGLGDFVPKSFDYLFLTFCYIGIGLALTTMAIELASDILRKLHYVGRKMDNVASAVVWFGGKKMTIKKLIKYLGDALNIPEEDMAKLNLNQFIESAMKVEAGELKTLRKSIVKARSHDALSYSKLRHSNGSDIFYVDDRISRRTIGLPILLEDSVRTMETLPLNETVPPLDLEYSFFTDSSLPTSFDDEYMRTTSATNRKENNGPVRS